MDKAASLAVATTTWVDALRSVGDCGSLTALAAPSPRDGVHATLDVTDADPVALAALLNGRPVRLRSLVRDLAGHAAALRRVRAIRDDMREFAEQHGLAAGRLALGVATWTSPTGISRAAPILLRSLRIVARTASEDDFELALEAGYTLNRGLLDELTSDFALTVDPGIARRVSDPGEPTEVYDGLRRDTRPVPDFLVTHCLLLGTHTDAASALATDLDLVGALLSESTVLAAAAGCRPAPSPAADREGADPLADLGAPDRIDPAEEFLALDADAAQSVAITAVLAGRELVVEGAPGTGRTQTAVNMVAALAATGRPTLVLVENHVALKAFLAGMTAAGLGDLAFHPAGTAAGSEAGSQRLVAAVAAAAHPLPAESDLTAMHRRLTESRDLLRRHSERLHAVREPWGISGYGAQAALLGLPAQAASRVRFPVEVLTSLHGGLLAEVRDAVREWSELGGTTLTGLDTPWYGASVGTAADGERAQRLAAELAESSYPAARAGLERALTGAGLTPVAAVADWREALRLLRAVAETERLLGAEVWAAPLVDLVAATAGPDCRRDHPDRLGWQDRMAARRAAGRLWRGGKPVGTELHDALVRAVGQLGQWSQQSLRGAAPPRSAADLDTVEKSYAELLDGLAALQLFLPDRDLPRLSPAVLDKTLRGLASDPVLRRLPRLGELATRCSQLGLRPFLLDLHARRLAAELAPTAFEHAWFSSVLAHLAATDPVLGASDASVLRRAADTFREADREHLASTAPRLRRRLRERLALAMQQHPSQADAVRGASGRQPGAAGLRALLQDAPEVVLAAAPCWVMSPYAVPELLPPERCFDVVIVEEANAVSLPVVAPGLARARQTVLIGDRRQLPPLELPSPALDLDAADRAAGTSPQLQRSVLEAAAPGMPRVSLRTSYRRSDERLAGFVAATVYGGRLLTRPGSDRRDRLTYVPVPHRSGTPGQEDSVTAEVQKVVGLVIDHAVRSPEESFAVVTLGRRHADRIAAALRVALVGRPELGDIFRGDAPERFFVKPCSHVAGELRDVIFFSTGLGKTPEGRMPYTFGPMEAAGGERLLTVGLTRARERLTLVSSFAAADLDPARLHGAGPRLLRALLRYAEVPELRGTPYAGPPPPDGLDLDLRERLRAAGLPVVPDCGLGARRVALALAAPDDPDRLVLAVETDGPAAATAATVRDRDRLGPGSLALLGWAVHRVFATAWFRDPEAELAAIQAAYQAALSRT